MSFVDYFEKLEGKAKVAATLCIGGIYITISAALIQANSYLMKNDRFPFAPVLACGHMLGSFIGSIILYKVCPSLFTAMPNLKIDAGFVLKFVPIGGCFACSMILSNVAYMYMSVAFIQMLKECNIAFTYGLSLVVGLEKWKVTASTILLSIIFWTCIAAKGEIHFVWLGVLIQLGSQGFECTKIITQNLLMSNKNGPATKLDPLTTVLFMAPVCFVFSVGIYLTRIGEMPPDLVWSHFLTCWPQVLLSCAIAFALNVMISITIATIDGVGFVLCGVIKDIAIVASSALIMGDAVSPLQLCGFAGAILSVASYSTYKMNSKHFEDDKIITGFTNVINERLSQKA
jgi:hypothetical protein